MNCARGCSPPSEEERQNIMKWSENLENLLEHDQGRERFKRFLVQTDLDEDLDSVTFWEMSCELEQLLCTIKDLEKRCLGLPDGSMRNRFNAKSNSLINFASDKINFDLQQLKELMSIKNNPDECKRILPRAKASIIYLLKDSYEEFIKFQLDSRLSIDYR